MRITFILPPDALIGGIRVLATYAHRLAQRGHKVTVLQPRGTPPTFRQIIRSLRHNHALPKRPERGPSYFDALAHPNLQRIRLAHPGPIAPEQVPPGDILIATWWETVEWVWACPASKGLKVHFMQDYEIWGQNEGGVARVDATCRLPIPKIVIAQWVGDLLATRFGQEPLALIPNAVDTGLFHAPPRGRQPLATVGFTYTPMPNKGADIAIAAINLARLNLPELKIISFGNCPVSTTLPPPEGTEYFFRVPDHVLPSLYAACDAWLFASRVEGFGLPILEAMACRTPVIATPAGAAPELLAHGGGIEVPHENPQAMADALTRIATMPEKSWQSLSAAALATVANYTWDDAADRLEAALMQLHTGNPVAQRT